jgi:predicted CXXCH cytochrome family protein
MKRKFLILLSLTFMVMVVSGTLTARYAAATVSGGKHDLSLFGGAYFQYLTDEVCIFCHTPHAANVNTVYSTNPNTRTNTGTGNTALGGKFLWNRALPDRTWSVYSSATLNSDTSGGPGTLSLMCLSCHDGVGAMNVLLNYTPEGQPASFNAENQFGDGPSDSIWASLNIGGGNCTGDDCTGGGDLQNDHPIGFVYNSALDTGLNPLGSLNAILQKRMAITGNRMECSTCHDPHLTNPGGNNFLVMSNSGSALCLQCHNK